MIDQRVKDGKPLTITFHGKMDEAGEPPTEQWLAAFAEIMDYFQAKRDEGEIEVVTGLQLANLYVPD